MNFKSKSNIAVLLVFILLLCSASAFANEEKHEEKGPFNLKEMIFSHVLDSYNWHLLSVGEKHYSIPLPIIVKSPERGWFVFSSARLDHENGFVG